jgi:hypothetical protein
MAQRLTASRKQALKSEVADWDETSDADLLRLFDAGQPVRTRLRRSARKTLIIALDEQTLNWLKRAARRRQVDPKALAAIWVVERLAKEQTASKHRAKPY